MVRLSGLFVGFCMALIAASVGIVLYVYFGMTSAEAAIVTVVAFTALAVYNTIATRTRDRSEAGTQIADLSRGTADLARQVIDLGRRVAAVEAKADKALAQAADAGKPLTAEIDELANLINQIATSVAAHDAVLNATAENPGGEGEASFLAANAETAPMVAAPVPVPAAAAVPVATDAAAPRPAPRAGAASRLAGLDQAAIVALLREAIEANRVDLYLQPIVMLPQRKVRFYEALARLRTADGEIVTPADFLGHAATGGLLPRLDTAMLLRSVQAVRRLMSHNREVGLFCNISPATLADADAFRAFSEFAEANRALAPAFVFEVAQADYRTIGPIESESLGALAARGFRFSLDHVGDLRLAPRDLAEHGFRFVKVPASVLLHRAAASAADIHPADLAGLLNRHGISLIAEKIEAEATVVDLLDYDVKLGQGYLFAPPRPVRPEVLQGTERRETADTELPRARLMVPAITPPPRNEAPPKSFASPGSALAQLARAMKARK